MDIRPLSIVSLALLALCAQPGHNPPVLSLQRVAALHTARSVHTATALPSGKVLITGGMEDGGGSVASAELFDPAKNIVERVGSLESPRAGHTATLLGDGRVLIAGGYDGEYLATLEVFEPSTKRFRPAGTLAEARSGHTATLLENGRVLFVGGVGHGWTFLGSAELFDPETGRSERVGAMTSPRESHTATLIEDGRVLIIGGHAGRRANMQVHASAEAFSLRSNRFEPVGELQTPRHKHDAVRLDDGRILVIGGADRTDRIHYASTEIYDPASGTFEPGPSMVHRRYKIAGTSILLPGGDVLVTSGAPAPERLDPRTATFHEVQGRYPEAYRFAAAATLPDGDVLIAGGYSDSNRNTAGVWRYHLP